MFIIFLILFLFFSLFLGKRYFLKNLYSNETSITGKIIIKCENSKLEFENLINNWVKELYKNDLISIFMPKNSDEVLILCSYYKTNKINDSKIIAVQKQVLESFINEQLNLEILIQETPKKNIFLSCKFDKTHFDIMLKLPYFHDKPYEIDIIENVHDLKNLLTGQALKMLEI